MFKGGNEDDVSNYRPISLLPVLSKILEKIVADQLTLYLESNKLLSNNQHGFRPKLSTETALLELSNNVYYNIDKKKISLLLLLDLSKAFDSVNHDILMKKMYNLKIDPLWFKSYLSNRFQSVRIAGKLSNKHSISYGVPQGSILGPILFSIFINDLHESFPDCLIVQYADDTQILLSGDIDNIQELINKAENILRRAKRYFQMNGLMLNEKKTQVIFIGSRQYISRIPNDISINFSGNVISPSKQVKNLGVYFDNYMNFNIHIDEMTRKISGLLFYLNRIKDQLDSTIRTIVVQSLVLTVLNYCSTIWGMANKTQIDRVQKLQNFAAKVSVGGLRKYDHVQPAFEKLKWLKVKNKINHDICIIVFKIINNYFPEWFCKLPTVEQVRDLPTRQRLDIYTPRSRTDLGARALKVKGPSLWNALPTEIKRANNIRGFKCKLKDYFRNR